MRRLTQTGRYIFAFCMMAFGVQQLLFHEFLSVFMPAWPARIPGHHFWTYFFGVFLIVIGLAIILNVKARLAALVLGIVCLLLLVSVHVPFLIANNPHSLLGWADAFTILALAGSAFIVASSGVAAGCSSVDPGRRRADSGSLLLAGRIGLCIMLITFGFEHFLYTDFIAALVPAWIPGHVFWTYFCGTALIGAGVAIIFGVGLRQVALLLGVMLLLWVVLLHVPRAIADPYSGLGGEWCSVWEALSFSGVAFILAGRGINDPLP